MFLAHTVVAHGAVFPVREHVDLTFEAVVGAGVFGAVDGGAVLGALPGAVEGVGDTVGPAAKVGVAIAVGQCLVELLHLGKRLGRREVEKVLLQGGAESVVGCVVGDAALVDDASCLGAFQSRFKGV